MDKASWDAAGNPKKRTVNDLAEFIAEATDQGNSRMRTIARRLREADLLSQYGRGRGAAVEA